MIMAPETLKPRVWNARTVRDIRPLPEHAYGPVGGVCQRHQCLE